MKKNKDSVLETGKETEREEPDKLSADEMEAVPELRVENPNALYEAVKFSGPPGSRFEMLQQLAHRHKRKIYALLLIAIVSSLFVGLRSTTPDSPEKLMKQYFARFNGHSEDWQYSIDQYHFTRSHLATLFPIIARFTLGNRGAAEIMREKSAGDIFARDQYETDLLVFAAVEEGILQDAEARTILENSLRHIIADYYVQKRLESSNGDYRGAVGDAEALTYYEKNQEMYVKNGIAKGKAIEMIKSTLSGLKREAQRQDMRVERSKMIQRLQERIGPRFREGKE